MAYPPVVIVDRQDNPVGLAMLPDAVAKGLHYRVVAVAVTDESGRILLQKRGQSVDISPGTWDISVAGHVDEGQTYQIAVLRELEEELGITGKQPREFGKIFINNHFLQLYTLTMSSDTTFKPETDEVVDTRWFTPEEFGALLRDHPEQCAIFLRRIYAMEPGVFGLELAAVRR